MAFEGGEDDIGPPLPPQYKVQSKTCMQGWYTGVGPGIVEKEVVELVQMFLKFSFPAPINTVLCDRNW